MDYEPSQKRTQDGEEHIQPTQNKVYQTTQDPWFDNPLAFTLQKKPTTSTHKLTADSSSRFHTPRRKSENGIKIC